MKDFSQRMYWIWHELGKAEINCTIGPCYEGYMITFPNDKGDVACHRGTYGNASGMVETYQFPWDDGDVSCLTPQEAVERIINYFRSKG